MTWEASTADKRQYVNWCLPVRNSLTGWTNKWGPFNLPDSSLSKWTVLWGEGQRSFYPVRPSYPPGLEKC